MEVKDNIEILITIAYTVIFDLVTLIYVTVELTIIFYCMAYLS